MPDRLRLLRERTAAEPVAGPLARLGQASGPHTLDPLATIRTKHGSPVVPYVLGAMALTDTSPSAARFLTEANRSLTPAKRIERVVALNGALDAFVEAGIRMQNPGFSESEVSDLAAQRRLGEDLFRKAAAVRDRTRSLHGRK